MGVRLKVMKSFLPLNYRKPADDNGEVTITLSLTFCWKVFRIILVTILAFVLGNFFFVFLNEYADVHRTDRSDLLIESDDLLFYTSDLEGVQRKQKARKDRVSQYCSLNNSPKFLSAHEKKLLYNRLFVDHEHRFVYCSVPKAACTKWKQIITKSSDLAPYRDTSIEQIFPHWDRNFNRLSDLDSSKALLVLQQYEVFTFSRHPLVRLVSSWRDKFQHQSKENRSDYINFHHQYGRHIIKRFRKDYNPEDLEKGFPISFQEYINYITSFSNADEMNEHWIPMPNICRPCHIKYSFIGSFENHKVESDYLIGKLGLSSLVPKDFFIESDGRSSAEAKQLLSALTKEEKKILRSLYQKDADLFGYSLDNYLGDNPERPKFQNDG